MSGSDYFTAPGFESPSKGALPLDEIDPFTGLRTNRTPLAEVSDEQFLKAIFDEAHYAQAWVAAYGAFAGGFAPSTLKSLSTQTSRYYSIATMKPGATMRKIRSAEAVHVLVLDDVGDVAHDVDNVTPISGARLDWSVIRTLPIPPSFVVETSKGNFQVGYILSTPEKDLQRWSRFVKALQNRKLWPASLHGAASVHYFRLPSGKSHKVEKARFETRLTYWEPGQTYTQAQLADAFGLGPWDSAQPTQSAAPTSQLERLPNELIMAILDVIPNDVAIFPDEETWNLWCQELKGAATDRFDPELIERWVKWSESWNGPWSRAAHKDPREVWENAGADTTYAGSLRNWLAQNAGHPKPNDPDFTLKEKIASALDGLDLHPSMLTPIEPEPASVVAGLDDIFERLRLARPIPAAYDRPVSTGLETFDPAQVSIIEPIVPSVVGYYTRGKTTMLLAVPGAGKSSLMVSTAMSLLFERPDIMAQSDIGFPGESILVSNEDDKAIVSGKLRALMDHHNLDPKDAKNQVHLFEGLKVLSRDAVSGKISLACTHFLEELISLRKQKDIALIVFDTLASLLRGFEENSNDQMQVVMEFFRKLADCAHAAVVVVHHVSKSGIGRDGEISIYGGRGASSMIGDSRSTLQALKPSPLDCRTHGWDATQAKAWVKVQPLKGSYEDPTQWLPQWFHFKSVLRPAFDPRTNTQTKRSYGVLVPETPAVVTTAQAAFGTGMTARQLWPVLEAAFKRGKVWGLDKAQKEKKPQNAKDLFGLSVEDARKVLDQFTAWGLIRIPNKELREIVKCEGVELPPEMDGNDDENGLE